MTESEIQKTLITFAETPTKPVRSPILRWPEEYGLEYENIFFPSMDGVPLDGWFIPAKGSNKLIICNHPLWFNRYGFPGHIEPWHSMFAAAGNTFEVNFMPDYKNLHDAGYNVLVYDLRNFGLSGAASGGVCTNGLREARDVIGSLQYVNSRSDLKGMTKGLFSRCMGANATIIAMAKHPEYFTDIKCMVAPQPISLRAFYEVTLGNMGMPERINELDTEIKKVTGFPMDEMQPNQYSKYVKVPTFMTQVKDDVMSRPADVQEIFDNIPGTDKKLFWIEGTTRRFDGYNYFPENPAMMLDFFAKYM
jgi:dipeptidyl aminopeptidase/acylaminoacyl peptidase